MSFLEKDPLLLTFLIGLSSLQKSPNFLKVIISQKVNNILRIFFDQTFGIFALEKNNYVVYTKVKK